MRKIIFSALVLSVVTANAQTATGMVGVNTENPKATLHIEAGDSESKGLIIPRITPDEMKTMSNLSHFGQDQHAIIVYLLLNMPEADRTGKLEKVDEYGYYFYNAYNNKWQKFGGSAEQDLRYINGNHLTLDAGIGDNGTSLGSSSGNIAIGPRTFTGFANKTDMTGYNNMALGNNIYYNNTGTMSGYYNTGIGTHLYQMQNGGTMQGAYNVALGSSLFNLDKAGADFRGGNNMALGNSLFYLNKANVVFTGYSNMALGQASFHLDNGDFTGGNNVAIGQGLFRLIGGGDLTGGNNIALGENSFNLSGGNFNGRYNMSLGSSNFSSYNGDFEGQYNTAVGFGHFNVSNGNFTGQYNTAIGYNAIGTGNGGISGSYNIAFGYNAMNSSSISGEHNIAIGQSAMTGGASGITGSHNISIGSNGYNAQGTGNRNIFIGNSSSGPDTPGVPDNIIVIGSTYSFHSGTKDGTVIIASNVYNAPIILGDSGHNNKVGIGVSDPQAKLDVNGDIKVGYGSTNCDPQNYGTIRFDGANFYGCTNSGWKQLNNY